MSLIYYILIALAVLVLAFVGFVATRPSGFRVARSAKMSAPASAVFVQVNDFHLWDAWSPWVKIDPAAKTSFEGPSSGTGAHFKWAGNKDIGEGSMTITESRPNDLIKIRLDFLKPFAGTSDVEFTFKPEGNQTLVTWAMSGRNNFIARAVCMFMSMDKMVGDKYAEGLTSMKAIVEAK